MDHFSVCTFCRPILFILATPQSVACCAAGELVTRAPISSLSSVKYWKAWEFIRPSPAIRVRACLVPSSSGPLGLPKSLAQPGVLVSPKARTRPSNSFFIPTPLTRFCRHRKLPLYHGLRGLSRGRRVSVLRSAPCTGRNDSKRAALPVHRATLHFFREPFETSDRFAGLTVLRGCDGSLATARSAKNGGKSCQPGAVGKR